MVVSSRIPPDVSYKIIDNNVLPGIKRGLTVRLNKRVSQDTLVAIAQELKSKDSRSYRRTFIAYLLPGMEPGMGAWATTHFDPDLKVEILGLTAEDDLLLEQFPEDSDREIIRAWKDDRAIAEARITLFREDGKLYIEWDHGSTGIMTGRYEREIKRQQSSVGERFADTNASLDGDYYVINSSGDLELRDGDGLISTAVTIERKADTLPLVNPSDALSVCLHGDKSIGKRVTWTGVVESQSKDRKSIAIVCDGVLVEGEFGEGKPEHAAGSRVDVRGRIELIGVITIRLKDCQIRKAKVD